MLGAWDCQVRNGRFHGSLPNGPAVCLAWYALGTVAHHSDEASIIATNRQRHELCINAELVEPRLGLLNQPTDGGEKILATWPQLSRTTTLVTTSLACCEYARFGAHSEADVLVAELLLNGLQAVRQSAVTIAMVTSRDFLNCLRFIRERMAPPMSKNVRQLPNQMYYDNFLN